ncbi:MAG: heme exporter protein CcmD [Alphaproteobacteria bacterium]
MADYLVMEGYAGFIWSAWAIAAMLMLAIWAVSERLLRHQAALLAGLEAAENIDA